MTRGAVNGSARRVGRRWPLFIVAVLVLQAGGVIGMVVISGRDPSFAVEPDYYQKALAWDDTARQRQAGAALGWKAEVAAATGDRLTVTLLDALDRPLDGAQIQAEVFHHARAADRLAATLAPAGEGRYSASLPMSRRGHWEVRLFITRGPETMSLTRHVEVGGATP